MRVTLCGVQNGGKLVTLSGSEELEVEYRYCA
jgi:hypothetical protein